MAFPPQTLTRAVWRNIIGNLSNHFGEDASLDAATVKYLLAYHEANASDVSDTRAAMELTGNDKPQLDLLEPGQILPYDDGTFELVVSWETMHWLGVERIVFAIYGGL